MHILAVTDQHAQSLGGVQVALRLQRKYLERLGHTLSIVAPALHRPHERHDNDIDLPSWSITKDREYGVSWPGKRTDAFVLRALNGKAPVDVVHIQGDFWGAMIGYRLAKRLNVPVVHTMHNNVDQGTRAVSLLAPVGFWALNVWRRMQLGATRSRQKGAWKYLASLAEHANVVTAPSAHFAHELERHEVALPVVVTPNGVDDEVISGIQPHRATDGPVTFVWLGRMSNEKRIMQLLQALTLVKAVVRVELYGSGLLAKDVAKFIQLHDLADRVHQMGSVSHSEALAAISRADALVQTSIGFETQGLTVFEAYALGTPAVLSDANIAEDIGAELHWLVPDASVESLAKTLNEAAASLRLQPQRVSPEHAHHFLQSEQTQHMLGVYERVRAKQHQ